MLPRYEDLAFFWQPISFPNRLCRKKLLHFALSTPPLGTTSTTMMTFVREMLLTKTKYHWSVPDKVHCAHILVKTEHEARTILERLKKGEKFANIAKEVSLCPSGKRGGDLGTFTRGRMVKEFETCAFALQKGQISQIIKTKFGYHIIKRLG